MIVCLKNIQRIIFQISSHIHLVLSSGNCKSGVSSWTSVIFALPSHNNGMIRFEVRVSVIFCGAWLIIWNQNPVITAKRISFTCFICLFVKKCSVPRERVFGWKWFCFLNDYANLHWTGGYVFLIYYPTVNFDGWNCWDYYSLNIYLAYFFSILTLWQSDTNCNNLIQIVVTVACIRYSEDFFRRF